MDATIDDVVFLKGRRVYLRPITVADIPLMLRWVNDQEVNQFLGAYLPVVEADEIAWLERLHKHKNEEMVFVIAHRKSGLPIGSMGLHGINWKDGTATTGALIGEKRFWGKGYGTEAKMILLDYAFNQLNLRKICSRVISFNERSWAYLKKCGYQEEGVLKEHIFKNGRFWDLIHLAVFKSDWLPLWEKFKKANRLR